MNLRKDHCRNLLERATVGLVHLKGGEDGLSSSAPPVRGEGVLGRGASLRCGPTPYVLVPSGQPNSGARSAKENGQTVCVPVGPGDGVPLGRAQLFRRVY